MSEVAWEMKVAQTQHDKDKLLSEGWEPFAVVDFNRPPFALTENHYVYFKRQIVVE